MEVLISSHKFTEYEKLLCFSFVGEFPNPKETFEKNKRFLIYKLSVLPWESLEPFIHSQMSTKFRSELSMNGLKLDVLKSGIQKYIRRSNFEKAMWCCIELDLFAYITQGEKIRTNMIHRLMVIYLEEISIVNFGMIKYVSRVVFELLNIRKTRKRLSMNHKFRKVRAREMKLLVALVHALASSEHGRILSHYNSAITQFDNIPEARPVAKILYPSILEIHEHIDDLPPPKLKVHLEPNESKTRKAVDNMVSALELSFDTALFWAQRVLTEVSEIENREKHYNKKNPEFLVFYILETYIDTYKPFDKSYFDVCFKWFIELKIKENFMCFSILILAIINAIKGIIREYKPKGIARAKVKELYAQNMRNEMIEIDDYVIDMHTRQGKMAGSGKKIFALEGSKVENESKLVNRLYKNFYTDVGIAKGDGIDSLSLNEGDVLEFEIRAQLICAKTRPDTYFALFKKEERNVFVKGPYLDKEQALMPLKIYKLKEVLGIRAVPVSMIKLIPGSIKTILGCRTQIEYGIKYPFLIFRDMTEHTEPLPFIEKESKLWPLTKVVDWSSVEVCTIPNVLNLEGVVLFEYLVAVLFRYALGIPDMADRNFLLYKNREIYSVDEEGWGKAVNLRTSLKGKKADFVKEKTLEVNKELIVVFTKWLQILENTTLEYPESFAENLKKMKKQKFIESIFS